MEALPGANVPANNLLEQWREVGKQTRKHCEGEKECKREREIT